MWIHVKWNYIQWRYSCTVSPLTLSTQVIYPMKIFWNGFSPHPFHSGNISNEDILVRFLPHPFHSDKDPDTRNGGVCMYFKEYLPIKERCDLEILPETIVAEFSSRERKFLLFSLIVTQTCQWWVCGIFEPIGEYLQIYMERKSYGFYSMRGF